MTNRLPSDADAVRTTPADIVRDGGTQRPAVQLDESIELQAGDTIRLVLDRSTYYAMIHRVSDGYFLRGAYDNRRLARTAGGGENRLRRWLRTVDRGPGDVVDCDTVVPGELYGLRCPGDRTVYTVTQDPKDSLADIARDLDG